MTTAQEVEKHALLRQYAALIQKYADAVAENVRLREAMDKYSEDEMLLIERCAKACEVVYENYESKCDTWPEARPDALSGAEDCIRAIRALKVERRKCERRVKQARQYFTENGNERSGNDRRKT